MDTQLHLGIARAIELCRRKCWSARRRAIITLSDGQDDFAGGMTKNEVLNQLKDDQFRFMPLVLSNAYNSGKESYLKTLGEFAQTSGGLYFNSANSGNSGNTINVDNTPLSEIYDKVRQSIIDDEPSLIAKIVLLTVGVHRRKWAWNQAQEP